MDKQYSLKIIGYVKSDFKTKFGIPRQSGIVAELLSSIVIEPEFSKSEAFRYLDQFSHIWLIWQFSKAIRENWSPTVRPPRLGGNKRVGVFATRSPFRPNALGLSCVKLEKVIQNDHGTIELVISGADLMDGTPIFDIKPYLPFTDAVPNAVGGFADEKYSYSLNVHFPENLLNLLPSDKRVSAIKILEHDPRPSYQHDANRIYGVEFAGFDIRFKVVDTNLTVVSVLKARADA